MRLIDADIAIDILDKTCDRVCVYSKKQRAVMCRACPLAHAFDVIEELPTANAVEVIRCAECKWFQCNMSMDGYSPEGVDEFECRHWCGSCDPVDFCSFAERRKDD